MSARFSRSVFCAVLSLAAVAPVAAQDVHNTVVEPAQAQPAPAPGVQSAPNTTVVQSPAPAAQTPVVVDKEPVVVDREPDARHAVVQQTNVDEDDRDEVSVFGHAAQGLLAGAVVGSAAGYLVGRKDGWERSDWRAVGLGVGIGSLSGAGLGLMLGFMDRGGVRAGRYIPRDMMAGTAVGALVGVVAGGIAAASADEPERVLFGTSVGALAGAGLGVITGIIEGQLKLGRETRTTTVTSGVKLTPTVAYDRRTHGGGALLTGLAGRF